MAGAGDTPMDSKQIWDAYWEPLQHKPNFYDVHHHTTHCIVDWSIDGKAGEPFWVKNVPGGKHAEHLVIERLERIFDDPIPPPSAIIKVKLYLNFSPCNLAPEATAKCCKALIEFNTDRKRTHPKFELEIAFVSLYKIIRASCLKAKENLCKKHLEYIKPIDGESSEERKARKEREDEQKRQESEANVCGLRQLQAELKPRPLKIFTVEDWKFVLRFLKRVGNPPRLEDARMKGDLDQILGTGLESEMGALGLGN